VRPAANHDVGRERRQFITDNLIAAVGTWTAGILGLLLQAIVSHHFHPAVFGQVFSVFSFYIVLTQPAAAFARMVAWSTSRALTADPPDDREASALLRSADRRLLLFGTVLAAACVAGAPWIGAFLHSPPFYVVLGAIGVPFLFSTSPLTASFQGQQRWVPWSVLNIAVALSRVIFVAVFGLLLGPPGVILGISVAAAATYLMALWMVRDRLHHVRGKVSWRPLRRFLLLSLASTLAASVLMGSDVILVEHFFGGTLGGQFSAVTVTSRALFFAMGSVTFVLFPKVAARHASSRSTRAVVAASVAVTLLAALGGLVVFSFGGHLILHLFSGKAYVGGQTYIGWYAMGMPLLAGVVMFSNTQQSLNDLGMLWVLIPGTILKPLLIILFHQTLLMVSLMSDVAIGALFVGMAIRYVMQERQMDRAFRAVPAAPSLAASTVSSTDVEDEDGVDETTSVDVNGVANPTRWPDAVAPSPAAELAAEARTANGHSGRRGDASSAEPRVDVAAMTSLDPRELVDGLLDRWEQTLAQRIHAEGRQRFEAELSARQDLVKQLQLELQLVRAEHAAAQAEKDRRLDERDHRVREMEHESLARQEEPPKRRRRFRSR
jgi:O-antigen/teichoic acid export membrane protein